MAYELHIYRKDSARALENVIAIEEWQMFCASDPSMALGDDISGRNPNTGETITISGTSTARWTSPSTQRQYFFDYRRGVISFIYSDDSIGKAKEIARALGAKIKGDEGEEY